MEREIQMGLLTIALNNTTNIMVEELKEYGLDPEGKGSLVYEMARSAHSHIREFMVEESRKEGRINEG
jgi:hypothetical protein